MPEGRQPRGITPRPRSGGAAKRRYPASEVRSGGREELPHAPMPEARGHGREELPHAPKPKAKGGGEGRWLGGPTPRPRSPGCEGVGGPRGAITH